MEDGLHLGHAAYLHPCLTVCLTKPLPPTRVMFTQSASFAAAARQPPAPSFHIDCSLDNMINVFTRTDVERKTECIRILSCPLIIQSVLIHYSLDINVLSWPPCMSPCQEDLTVLHCKTIPCQFQKTDVIMWWDQKKKILRVGEKAGVYIGHIHNSHPWDQSLLPVWNQAPPSFPEPYHMALSPNLTKHQRRLVSKINHDLFTSQSHKRCAFACQPKTQNTFTCWEEVVHVVDIVYTCKRRNWDWHSASLRSGWNITQTTSGVVPNFASIKQAGMFVSERLIISSLLTAVLQKDPSFSDWNYVCELTLSTHFEWKHCGRKLIFWSGSINQWNSKCNRLSFFIWVHVQEHT